MVKIVFYLLTVSFSLTLFGPEVWGRNQAAAWLAQKIYSEANQHIRTKQWQKALAEWELATWLDPSFQMAKQQKANWEIKLKNWAEQKYQMGLRAYQSQKFAEAKIHWQEAKQALWQTDDPLQTKIDVGLKLLRPGEVILPILSPKAHPDQGLAQKMAAVQEFLAAGEMEKARLTLAELVYQYPQNERAKKLLENLNQQGVTPTDDKTGKIYQQAETLFEQGKKTEVQGRGPSAYPFYTQAFTLLSPEPFKPWFFAELSQHKENLEDRLRAIMKPKLATWQTQLNQNKIDLKKLADDLRKITHDYPFLSEAKELLDKVYVGLDEKAKPFLIEAKTLQELEGCQVSVAKFKKVKEIGVFSEVPGWAEANKNLEVCKKAENRELRTENRNRNRNRNQKQKLKTEN